MLEDRKFYMKEGRTSAGENSVGIYGRIYWKGQALVCHILEVVDATLFSLALGCDWKQEC